MQRSCAYALLLVLGGMWFCSQGHALEGPRTASSHVTPSAAPVPVPQQPAQHQARFVTASVIRQLPRQANRPSLMVRIPLDRATVPTIRRP